MIEICRNALHWTTFSVSTQQQIWPATFEGVESSWQQSGAGVRAGVERCCAVSREQSGYSFAPPRQCSSRKQKVAWWLRSADADTAMLDIVDSGQLNISTVFTLSIQSVAVAVFLLFMLIKLIYSMHGIKCWRLDFPWKHILSRSGRSMSNLQPQRRCMRCMKGSVLTGQ